jgi:hypothetical protein
MSEPWRICHYDLWSRNQSRYSLFMQFIAAAEKVAWQHRRGKSLHVRRVWVVGRIGYILMCCYSQTLAVHSLCRYTGTGKAWMVKIRKIHHRASPNNSGWVSIALGLPVTTKRGVLCLLKCLKNNKLNWKQLVLDIRKLTLIGFSV